MDKETIKVVKSMEDATLKAFDLNAGSETKGSSEFAIQMECAANKDWGAHGSKVHHLCASILKQATGEVLPERYTSTSVRLGVFVPLQNTNGHNYAIGLPVLACGGNGYYQFGSVTKGTNLNGADTRPATRAEIKKYFKNLLLALSVYSGQNTKHAKAIAIRKYAMLEAI